MADKKLFVWDHEGVLQDYTDGIIFAYAENIDAARQAVIEKAHKEFDDTEFPECIDQIKSEIEKEPKVITGTEGFFLMGGG